MVKVNGASPDRQNTLCKMCGAKFNRVNGENVCPNGDRKDHHGQPYSGRV